MGLFKRFAVLLDAYGSLRLAIVATVAVCYLWGPCIQAVEQHEREEIRERSSQDQVEVDHTVEYLERLKSQTPATK